MGIKRMDLGPVVTEADVPFLKLALKEVQRAVNDADKALAVIDVGNDAILLRRAHVKALEADLDGNVDRDQFSITPDAANASVIGISILLAQLSKVKQTMQKLLLPLQSTEARIEALQELVDRLRDQKAWLEVSGGAR